MGLLSKMLFAAVILLQAAPARQVASGVVTGVLRTSTGEPMEGVRVAVTPAGDAVADTLLESLAQTDKEGRYRLENVSPGRYYILTGPVSAPLYHPGVTELDRATTIVVAAGETTEAAVMVFKRTSVAGRIVDVVSGAPRSGDSLTLCCKYVPSGIRLASSSAFGYNAFTLSPLTSSVKDDGTFIFPSVTPGAYYLQVAGPGIVPMAQPLVVDERDISGLEIQVTGGMEVRGVIADQLRDAVPAATVTLTAAAKNSVFEVTANSISNTYTVTSASRSGQPMSLRGSIDDIVARLPSARKPRIVTTGHDGRFSFAGALPGKYIVEATFPGGNSFSREVEVGTREPVEVSLDWPFTRVVGRILVEGGAELPRLTGSVRFVSSDPNAKIIFGFPDDEGRFAVFITPGEYRLFTDTMSIDPFIQSMTAGSVDLRSRRFQFDGTRQQEIRITIAP